MSEPSTFIKLDRNILQWEWYGDLVTKAVFLHLLLTANITDKEWQGMTIRRGQVATSYPVLAERLRISIRQARTALSHLKSTGEVTTTMNRRGLVITVVSYDRYQSVTGTASTKRQADDRHSVNLMTATKEYKEYKEEKNNPLYPPTGEDELFDRFWDAYPKVRHIAKAKCREKFQKLNADEDMVRRMVSALEYLKGTAQWQDGDGRYIPHPMTWLNQRRWEDEIPGQISIFGEEDDGRQ